MFAREFFSSRVASPGAAFFPLLLICAVALDAAVSDTVPSEKDLVARYDFDEGEGTILHDRSGHGFDGTLEGGPEWKAGVHGSSLYFNGIDAYVQLPADSAFLLDSFTVLAWVRPADQGPGTVERVIFSNCTSTAAPELVSGGSEFRFRHGELEGVSAGASYNGNWSDMFSPASVVDGAWHMVGFSVSKGMGRLWIDGVQAGNAVAWRPISQPPSLPQIGACLRNWASQGYFKGGIDEMRIYNRGLGVDEMVGLYAEFQSKPTRLNLGMGKAYGNPGDTVWVPVRLAALGAISVSAFQFTLRLDTSVARLFEVVSDSGLARNWSLQGWNGARGDSVPVALAGTAFPLGEGEGELLRFGFVIPGGARPGASGTLTLEDIRIDDKAALTITTIPGLITVAKPVALGGDVNHDGKINVFDAEAILEYVVGLRAANDSGDVFDTTRADVSGNGGISSYDAALVFQYGLGLIGDFPYELLRKAGVDGASFALTLPAADSSRGYLYSLTGNGLSGLSSAEFRFKLDESVTGVGQVVSSLYSNRVLSHFDLRTHTLEVAAVGDIPLGSDASDLLHIAVTTASGNSPGPMILESAYLNEGHLTGAGFASMPLRPSGSDVPIAGLVFPGLGARLTGNRILFGAITGASAELRVFDTRGRRLWLQSWSHAPSEFDLPERSWPRGLVLLRLTSGEHTTAWLRSAY
jgi:hypothetical protein